MVDNLSKNTKRHNGNMSQNLTDLLRAGHAVVIVRNGMSFTMFTVREKTIDVGSMDVAHFSMSYSLEGCASHLKHKATAGESWRGQA
jgi:hypothetical protein